MAKSKWLQVKAKLRIVEEWARSGLTEGQISANLGISRSTLSDFKNKHRELAEALTRGREVAVAQLENVLFNAIGYDYEVSKVSIRMIDGLEIKFTEKTRKYLPPDVAAIIFLLKNKDRANWSNDPVKRDLEREIFAFRKQVELARLYGDESQ